MNGEVTLILKTANLSYELRFERNISVILGDSGTGKSLLCTLLSQAQSGEDDIEVRLNGFGSYIVMPEVTQGSPVVRPWQDIVRDAEDTLFFIDEFCDCLHSGEFAQAIKYTTNYYILITRCPHGELPYSVEAIYTLNYHIGGGVEKIMNEPFHRSDNPTCAIDCYITEDSGAGNMFIGALYNTTALAAGSKSNFIKPIRTALKTGYKNLFLMADGAAFGSGYLRLVRTLDALDISYILYMPESFEWLLLHSQVFSGNVTVLKILSDFLKIVDYSKFFSLEQFFTCTFKQICLDMNLQPYDKSRQSLDSVFVLPSNLRAIKDFIKYELQENDSPNKKLSTNVFDS